MTEEQIFNKKINKLLKESTNSNVSNFINSFGSVQNYYFFLDEFCHELGMGFGVQEVLNDKNNNSLGFLPYIKYYADDSILKKSEKDQKFETMKLKSSIEFLAKNIIYKLMSIKNEKDYLDTLNKFKSSSINY